MTPPIMATMLSLSAFYSNLTVSTTAGLLANAWYFEGGVLANTSSRVTFLAPVDMFFVMNLPNYEERMYQLLSPLWAPHTRDLLSHAMLTTAYSREELVDLASDTPYNFLTLGGTYIGLRVSQDGQLTIGDSIMLDPSMRAIDG